MPVLRQDIYLAESAKWNVEKFVHVAAATGTIPAPRPWSSTRSRKSTGHPDAIVGGIVPDDPVADAIAAARRPDGVVPLSGGSLDGRGPRRRAEREILGALQDRGLVFDLMVHADELRGAAAKLAEWGDLDDRGRTRRLAPDEHRRRVRDVEGRDGDTRVARPQRNCKLSGLAMPLHSMMPPRSSRGSSTRIEVFGVDRCLFASNFPVDAMHGTFDELFTAYDEFTADLDDADARASCSRAPPSVLIAAS